MGSGAALAHFYKDDHSVLCVLCHFFCNFHPPFAPRSMAITMPPILGLAPQVGVGGGEAEPEINQLINT